MWLYVLAAALCGVAVGQLVGALYERSLSRREQRRRRSAGGGVTG